MHCFGMLYFLEGLLISLFHGMQNQKWNGVGNEIISSIRSVNQRNFLQIKFSHSNLQRITIFSRITS